jgi:hypothetical protein
MINLLWSGIVFVLLLSGCGWNGTPTRQNDFTPLASIEISAVSPTIAAGTSTKLSATGVFVGGLPAGDITDKVIWSSDTPLVASFPYTTSPNKNRVVGNAPGTATLTATKGGVSATFKLTVSNATVTAVTITPVAPSISQGLNIQFAASGTFSGTPTTTQDLTFDAIWAPSPGTFATVSNDPTSKGLATALKAGIGIETISATFGGVIGSTTLTVTVPVLQSITVTPANLSILSLLSTGSFQAIGHFSDGTNPDITSQVVWTSSDTTIATIATTGGAATTLSSGTISIIATPLSSVPSNPGVTGTTALKVTGGNLNRVTVSPAIVILANGTVSRLTATGTFSNGSMRDITGTGAVQWTLLNTALATVTTPGGNLALLTANALTGTTPVTTTVTATVTAPSGTLTFPTSLTVTTPQPLLSFAISTTSPELTAGSLTAGTSARFTVTANFNGVLQDVTTLSGWTSDNQAIATVGTSGLAAGRVTGVGNGSTIIRATYTNNSITAVPVQATVNVRSRSLQSLTISPPIVTIGNQVQFTATANYTDGTKDVTEDTTWSIDNPNVAIMADKVNQLNQPGQVVGVDIGSATLTATLGVPTPTTTKTTTITVTGP